MQIAILSKSNNNSKIKENFAASTAISNSEGNYVKLVSYKVATIALSVEDMRVRFKN